MGAALSLIRETYAGWERHHTAHLAAALAFYLAFSLAPLLVIAIAVAGLVLGPHAASQDILGPVRDFLGPSGARFVTSLMANLNRPTPNIVAGAIGVIALVFGASGAFIQLHDALNIIFDVTRRRSQWRALLRARFFSFLMVALIGILLLASQVFDAALATAVEVAGKETGSGLILARVIGFAISFILVSMLFALLFKFVPEGAIEWRDALVGGMFTAVFFLLGQWLLSMYVRYAAFHAIRGVAAALLIVMSWLYYLAQLVFFGAEFTRAYAFRRKQTDLPGIAVNQ